MILDINIINNKSDIEFLVDIKTKDVLYVYLDVYENHSNYLSNDDTKHTYKFNGLDIIVGRDSMVSRYRINKDLLIPDQKILGMYILSVVYDDGSIEHAVAYDLNELYCLRLKYMTNCCDTCQDSASYKKLITLMFKEMLLRNAMGLNMVDESLKLYREIFRPFCKDGSLNESINTSQFCSSGICKIC